jgi:hypothetical protein
MEVADARGKNILRGVHVRYRGTGSAGEVLDVKTDAEGTWAKMDTTKLWYNSQFLEVVDKKEFERTKLKEVQRAQKQKEAEEHVQKVVNMKKKLEDIDMSSELCDGGG